MGWLLYSGGMCEGRMMLFEEECCLSDSLWLVGVVVSP